MILDIFNDNSFSNIELSGAINAVPNKHGILQQRNAFPDRGVRTRIVSIERKDGKLTLLPTKPVGSPATLGTSQKRNLRHLEIPHIPYEDTVHASDVQGVRAFGSDNELASVRELINEKQVAMADNHFVTREHLRFGALRGIILDADGSTIYNLFDEFSVTQPTHDIALGTSGTNVGARVRALKSAVSKAAKGQAYGRIRVLCAPDFFDAFTSHAQVEKFFTAFNNAGILLNEDHTDGFPFQKVIFEQVDASWVDANGTERKAIPDGTGQVFLENAPGLYATLNAPADFMETVNMPGQPLYSSIEVMKHNRGVELHTQSNPLALCWRPELLFKVTMS